VTELLLFAPLALRGVTFKNRVMASPMWQYSGRDFFPTDWHFMHLGRMAAGGASLVMQEGTAVERRGCGSVADIGIWDDRFIAPLRRITDFVRSFGAVPGIQLLHCGRRAKMELPWGGRRALTVAPDGLDDFAEWDVVGPSAVAQSAEYHTPRALALAEIATIVEAWAAAAGRAAKAGYDVIEIHAAHGYLIHEFLSPAANRRTYRYGGSLENRCRLLIEIVEAVRARWPADKPVFVRLSIEDEAGWSIGDSVALIRVLKSAGADAIDCSAGGIANSPLLSKDAGEYGYQVGLAERVRAETDIPTIAVGLIVHADQAEAILRTGQADMVAIGRELLYNPNWPIDAAQKLGADPTFSLAPLQHGFYLERRAKSFVGRPSTFQVGIDPQAES
jgi:2,4-dienoyl-CoA reductase-like NADH-dependent reductase (Old Yellow Enzyme family)